MRGANCYWALLRNDGSGTLETAASEAAMAPAALASSQAEASPSSSDEDDDAPPPPPPLPHRFHLFDASLRGFLTSAGCLTRDSERYSVEARSLASSGSFDAAFLFLGRALEAAAISKAMSELEASTLVAAAGNESGSSSTFSSSCRASAASAAAAAAASVSATTGAFSAHLARCVERTRALAAIRRSSPAAYAVLSREVGAGAAAPPPPVPLFAAVGGGAASVTFAGAAAAAAAEPPPTPERPHKPPAQHTDALRDRLRALAAGAGCLPTWPPRGASSSALLC